MDVQEVEVTIDEKGQVLVHVRGVKGEECLKITAGLEQALGGQVELRELTPEAQEGDNPIGSQQRLQGNA